MDSMQSSAATHLRKSQHTYKLVSPILGLLLCVAAFCARADKVDDLVAAQMNRQHIPGLSLAVLKNGKAVKLKGYGVANLELGTRSTPATVFQIGSMSKQFIATGIVFLNEEGKIDLDDSVAKYIPDAPQTWQAITVRHLLTHTSGLVRETPDLQLKAQSEIEAIRSAYPAPLSFKPGDKWQYSNLGYFVLAEIINQAAHVPWPQYLEQRIFTPLGMSATRTTTVEELVADRASGYHWMDSGTFHNAQILPGVRPSGAFLSSVLDLTKWDAALYSDEFLSSEKRELMWTPVKLNDGSEKPYGFGWEVGKTGKHRHVKHAGTMLGFRSQLLRFPDDRLSVVVLTNATQASPEKIGMRVAALYIPDLNPPQPERKSTKQRSQILDTYTGSYQLAADRLLKVSRRGDQLALSMPMATPALGKEVAALVQGVSMDLALLTAENETRFFDEDDPRLTYVFATDADGKTQLQVENEKGDVMQRASKISSSP
jgi:CubicO group peptidase (beta-lactamase class C family)